MPQQSWTIGSDSSCDVVVNNSTVSSQHCRLVSDGSELTLTDLGSTNGTFVNGKRLSGLSKISTTDRITLGQTLPMPWPESLNFVDARPLVNPSRSNRSAKTPQIISLGRGSDNTVVLSGSNISTHHARMLVNDAEIVIEDLGSTNGTSIGKVENKISRAIVQESDTVFLGSIAYQVSDLLSRSEPNSVAPMNRGTNSAQPENVKSNRTVVFAALACSALLVVMIGWLAMRNRGISQTEPSEMLMTASAMPESEDTKIPSATMSAENVEIQSVTESAEVGLSPEEVSPEEALSRSIFLIVCADTERETPFRVGTGFAIDSESIVTTAAVIQAMRSLQQDGYPDAFLFSPATDSELEIASVTTHPQFESADKVAREAQQEHDTIFDQLESQPPNPEAFESVKDRLVAARIKALEAIDQKTTYDVGILRASRPVSHWLPEADVDIKLRANQKLNVAGFAFDIEDPYFDRTAPIELSTIASRFGRLVKSTEGSTNRIVAKGIAQQNDLAYLGSPVMNATGQVVGIYSRPTPPMAESALAPDPSFDAPLIQRVLECLHP
ncbi:FHA domain-containing protein [Stieleria varia]|uniref:FHA domain-containing protein FhaB n=1 Tax=Stieleria varia TaxID=2528005 RepID=A0A5C6B3M2_9BACT|nr:FHA domain-containing protein [Stieleria varia]TWU05094.1 FHA domain-containing protein FhaB [Stieleria varia]